MVVYDYGFDFGIVEYCGVMCFFFFKCKFCIVVIYYIVVKEGCVVLINWWQGVVGQIGQNCGVNGMYMYYIVCMWVGVVD